MERQQCSRGGTSQLIKEAHFLSRRDGAASSFSLLRPVLMVFPDACNKWSAPSFIFLTPPQAISLSVDAHNLNDEPHWSQVALLQFGCSKVCNPKYQDTDLWGCSNGEFTVMRMVLECSATRKLPGLGRDCGRKSCGTTASRPEPIMPGPSNRGTMNRRVTCNSTYRKASLQIQSCMHTCR